MNLKHYLRIAVSVVAVSASAAVAGDCGYNKCWGAVAVGTNGEWGWSNGQFSENDAINVAQNGCSWNCDIVRTFYNTCGAISKADNGAWGFGWAGSREIAEGLSLDYCLDNGFICQVRVWACSH